MRPALPRSSRKTSSSIDHPISSRYFSGGLFENRAQEESSHVSEKQLKIIRPAADFEGELGNWVSALDELRLATRKAVSGLSPEQLAWKPFSAGNSIGQ